MKKIANREQLMAKQFAAAATTATTTAATTATTTATTATTTTTSAAASPKRKYRKFGQLVFKKWTKHNRAAFSISAGINECPNQDNRE